LHVLDPEVGLEHDGSREWIVGGHEHRRDDETLAALEVRKIPEGCLKLICRAKSSVVGPVGRLATIATPERRPSKRLKMSAYGSLNDVISGQRGWSALCTSAVDPFVSEAS
jgi:hypothetical protein